MKNEQRIKQHIYISGKITGVKNLNKPKFEEAEDRLRAAGYIPVNPHNILPYSPRWTWADYMKADIKALMDCHLVAVLDDWKQSPGSNVEVKLALKLGMQIICAHTLQVIECDDENQIKRVPNKYIVKEVKRELDMRKRVYPDWIRGGRITQEDATHRIKVMEQVLNDYKDVVFVGASTARPIEPQAKLF